MNLLKKEKHIIDPNYIQIEHFKQFQYSQLKSIIELTIDYISKQHNNYLTLCDIELREKNTYFGINNTELLELKVYIKKNDEDKTLFFRLYIPRLVDDNFFIINGNTYVPTMYILDKPISVKKQSIKLAGLFNSITIYMGQSIAIFTGIKIPILNLLHLIFTEPNELLVIDEFLTKFNINKKAINDKNILNYFNRVFNANPDRSGAIDKLERLFLDDYTKYLYQYCYGMEDVNLKNILMKSIEMGLSDDRPSFIDLSHKRVIFLELLLTPLLKKVAHIASTVSKGALFGDKLQIDADTIVKHFINNLNSKFLYDITNLYSSILIHKVSMLNPGSTNPPSSISQLHQTHYNRICPVSVSSQDPGETVSVVPGTLLDPFGHFV